MGTFTPATSQTVYEGEERVFYRHADVCSLLVRWPPDQDFVLGPADNAAGRMVVGVLRGVLPCPQLRAPRMFIEAHTGPESCQLEKQAQTAPVPVQ